MGEAEGEEERDHKLIYHVYIVEIKKDEWVNASVYRVGGREC